MSKEIINEEKYLRVTTPLKRYSGYENVPVNILEYAADRGTRVHNFCELYALGMLFEEVDADCFEYVQAFIKWFDENVESIVSTEERFFCDKLLIQGQIDMLAKLKGREKTCCIDIKTSLNPSKTWGLQTAAYKWLAETNGHEISNRIIIQVKKNGTFKEHVYCDKYAYHTDLKVYESILAAHRYFS